MYISILISIKLVQVNFIMTYQPNWISAATYMLSNWMLSCYQKRRPTCYQTECYHVISAATMLSNWMLSCNQRGDLHVIILNDIMLLAWRPTCYHVISVATYMVSCYQRSDLHVTILNVIMLSAWWPTCYHVISVATYMLSYRMEFVLSALLR